MSLHATISAILPTLSPYELANLHTTILELLQPSYPPINEAEIVHHTLACPECGSTACVKNGKVHNKQRMLCRDCGRTFGLNTGSCLMHTKLSRQTWNKYVTCMIEGYSIRKSATIVGVSVKTSFFMRHKILDAIHIHMERSNVSGIVEMDETFVRESFKGNHTKGTFRIPRKARKRGNQATKRGISREQICVGTAIDRNNNVIMTMACKGRITKTCLKEIFDGHVKKGSTICTDGLVAYKTLANDLELVHKPIPTGKHSDGLFDLSRVNSLHSRFKGWIGRFNGVSTKFLPNYLGWFNWLEQNKDIRNRGNKMFANAMGERVDVRIDKLRHRSAVFVE